MAEKKDWWKRSVVYQIYPRSFCDSNGDGIGDLPGITSRLEYIRKLGTDVIWLSPVYRSPNVDNGYDIADYEQIMDEFGTMEDFDAMLAKAHELGLKIMMDLVVNHTSDQHRWFQESRKGPENPYRDYYIWKKPVDGHVPNNWGASFGAGSVWEWDEKSQMYYLHLFAKQMPDLNWDNPKLREEVFSMMRRWLEKGVDGFRMDVINLIGKDPAFPDGEITVHEFSDFYPVVANHPKVHEYLRQMYREVLSQYETITVGETPNATVEDAKIYTAEDENRELNMIFQFDHMGTDNGIHGRWSDKKPYLPDLKKAMSSWEDGLYGCGWNSLYWDNHDQPRAVSRFGNDSPEYRVISAKMLGTCLHMMQGTPYVFQGEELGMTNICLNIDEYEDIDTLDSYHQYVELEGMPHEEMMRYIHRRSRDNARTPMQWSAEENGGFTTGKPWFLVNPNYTEINAASQVDDPDSVFSYYRRLIALRKEMDIIVYGKYQLLLPEDENLWVYTREYQGEKLLVVCSFADRELEFAVPEEFSGAERLIGNYPSVEENKVRPYEAYVLYKK